MKKRYIAGAVAGAAVALWATQMWMKMARDLRRYNHIRSLSDEGPIQEEAPDMLLQLMTQERHALIAWGEFLKALPHDIARETKIFSM
jgi:hypothetical protein